MSQRAYAVIVSILACFLFACLIASYAQKGWLTIDSAADIATVVGSMVAVVTLIGISSQLRQQSRLARAANSQTFVSFAAGFILEITGDRHLSQLWHMKDGLYESLDGVEQARYRYLIQLWLNFYENLIYQHACGLIDDDVYSAWLQDETQFVSRQHVAEIWEAIRTNYTESYISHFDALVARARADVARTAAVP